jgi:hypothetical protein
VSGSFLCFVAALSLSTVVRPLLLLVWLCGAASSAVGVAVWCGSFSAVGVTAVWCGPFSVVGVTAVWCGPFTNVVVWLL